MNRGREGRSQGWQTVELGEVSMSRVLLPRYSHPGADAGIDLRDVQIAARHADPRTTMRYDRARNNLDRHANYILAAFMAAGT